MSNFVLCLVVLFFHCSLHVVNSNFCGQPPFIERAIPSSLEESHPLGSVVSYSCEFGYSAQGYRRSATCIVGNTPNTAVWSEYDIACIPRACGDPGFVSHASRNGSVFAFPHSVTYVCDEGYYLVGSRQRYCLTTGEWSGDLPTCEIVSCSIPQDPENGKVIFDSLDFGSELQYECNKGFLLKAAETRVCSSRGQWGGTEPTCSDVECTLPETPEHGSMELVGGRIAIGSIAIFACDSGYHLSGSTTSKCMKTGEWTFPPPKCYEPCSVPSLQHGRIGRYEGRNRYKTFKPIPKDTRISNGQEVILICSNKYEPAGEPKSQIKISCTNGVWSINPECVPAACRTDPPSVRNAQLSTQEITHGATLTYLCNKHFKKTAFGSTTCEFGSWVGKQPVCEDTRCPVNSLNFPGISYGRKTVYLNGESFIVECKEGYEISKRENVIILCSDGEWEVRSPPCKPASCKQPPPIPAEGKVTAHLQDHGTTLTYTCIDWHYLSESSSDGVKCLFGNWDGTPPLCKDSRCYTKDLSQMEGVKITDNGPAISQKFADLSCVSGYSLKYSKPRCLNGTWQYQNHLSPCQPSSCIVKDIENGWFMYQFAVQRYDWWKARYVTDIKYREAVIGSSHKHGSELFVSCRKPYLFGGVNNENYIRVHCEKGKWIPQPMCLERGALAFQLPPPTSEAVHTIFKANLTTAKTSTVTTVTRPATVLSTISNHKPPTQSDDSSFNEEKEPDVPVENILTTISVPEITESANIHEHENCSCTYTLRDENVIAYLGNESLEFGAKVKHGSGIKFYCRHMGYHYLKGNAEVFCNDCQWHSSMFPTCAEPNDGDAMIYLEANGNYSASILPSGVLRVPRGITMNISCEVKSNVAEWPELLIPFRKNLIFRQVSRGNKLALQAVVVLENTSKVYNGQYMCRATGSRPSHVEIEVEEPKSPDVPKGLVVVSLPSSSLLVKWQLPSAQDNVVLGYVVQWGKNSSALSSKQLDSNQSELTIENLEPATEYNITLVAFNSLGVSHAIYKVVKTLGESKNCSIPLLIDGLPENVVPKIEEVTLELMSSGTILNLTCAEEFKAVGSHSATCGYDGQWIVGNIQCIRGCEPVKRSHGSSLLIDPEKEVYRFGEYITFLCPPGQKLDSDSERVMCLRSGWSEDVLPNCQDLQ